MQISKKSLFDFAIIGAGISGASCAYFLKKRGKRVVVIDSDKIANGGSGAAGAFLSPKICSPSAYTAFINDSFEFSIKFYQDNFEKFLDITGILRVLKSKRDMEQCRFYEDVLPKKFIYLKPQDIKYLKKDACKFGAYFFEDGALIDSVGVVEAMLEDIEVIESLHVESLNYVGGHYEFGNIKAKGVVLCAGNSKDFSHLDFLGLKDICGHRIDVKTLTNLPFHMHKSCSISANRDGVVHIGATHIPNYRYSKDDCYKKEIKDMQEKAKSYLNFDCFEVQKIHFGVRNSTNDFYPVAGRVIDAKETLKKYPYITKGSKVPKESYVYYPHMFVHCGLGARGFVLAPKTAEILAKNICDNVPIDKKLDTQRLFLKYAKRKV
ncbi:MAG: FAD-binding oxidoreductase [Sulfurospirillum sp.]